MQGLEWQVDVDWGPFRDFNAGQPGQSIFEYIVKIDPTNEFFFDTIGLSATFGDGGDQAIVTEDIYTVINEHDKGQLRGTLTCQKVTGCTPDINLISHNLKKVYIVDTASTPGQLIDDYQNTFTQSTHIPVPAPLPILGAAAAFGSIRKARKFSAHLKTFSMG